MAAEPELPELPDVDDDEVFRFLITMAIQPRLAARHLDHFDFRQRKNPGR